MRVLDIGCCGKNKIDGAIGLDIHKTPATDVVCDLDIFPYPCKSFPVLFEKYFAFIFPAMNIEISLKVIK